MEALKNLAQECVRQSPNKMETAVDIYSFALADMELRHLELVTTALGLLG